jgi:hypothetical protein
LYLLINSATAVRKPYTREEILEERFGKLLRGLSFPKEILDWMLMGLREGHVNEKACHDEAIVRLQTEYRRLRKRVDAMYLDKLGGLIDTAFFDSKSTEWRTEHVRILRNSRRTRPLTRPALRRRSSCCSCRRVFFTPLPHRGGRLSRTTADCRRGVRVLRVERRVGAKPEGGQVWGSLDRIAVRSPPSERP